MDRVLTAPFGFLCLSLLGFHSMENQPLTETLRCVAPSLQSGSQRSKNKASSNAPAIQECYREKRNLDRLKQDEAMEHFSSV